MKFCSIGKEEEEEEEERRSYMLPRLVLSMFVSRTLLVEAL